MFSFFENKKYIANYLEGFIDIHNHILPGIDDGAESVEESILLLKEFLNLGVSRFISTPHIMNDYYTNNEETIVGAHKTLTNKLKKESLAQISINFAAEYMLDLQYESLLEEKKLLPLINNYILIEMSYLQAPLNLKNLIFRTFTQDYIPVLAHPERYSFFHGKTEALEQLKLQGVPFQLNILSLSNYYGSAVKKTAFQLLEKGMIDFIATDTHKLKHIEELKKIKLSEKEINLIRPVIDKTKEIFTA